jgi:chromosome segregation ATPase
MSQFQNIFKNENNSKTNIQINENNTINNDKNIKIINNSDNSVENKSDSINNNTNDSINNNNEINNNNDINIPNLLKNKYENNKIEESEENSDDETDLEREAAILLNKQYKHIKKLKEELNKKNNEIINLNTVIEDLNLKFQEKEENSQIINELKNEIDILNTEKNNLYMELNSKDQLIYELKTDLNTLSQKFNDLNQNLNSFSDIESNEKINNLISQNKKLSREIKSNEEKILSYEKEFNKLNKSLKNEMRQKQKLELLYTEKISEEKSWISQVNQDINLICQWVNNYLGAYFDKNIEIPDIPHISTPISSEGVLTYGKFNFEKLRKEIFDSRKKIWERQIGYDENVENLKKEQIDFIDKINKLNKDIARINNENILLREELNKRNINLDILQNQLNKYNFE